MTTLAEAKPGTLVNRHPLIFYFALTYAISWPLWLLSRLAGGTLGTVLLVMGGFGPMIAASDPARRSFRRRSGGRFGSSASPSRGRRNG